MPSLGQARTRAARQRDWMTLAVIEMLAGMDDDLEEEGWNQPSRLFIVHRQMAEPLGPNIDAILFQAHRIGPSPVGRNGADIAGRLTDTARAIADRGAEPDEDLFAWALIHEAWMVRKPADQAAAELDRWEGRLDQHPDRREIRNLLAVDTTGAVTMLNHIRGEDPLERRVVVDGDSTDSLQVGGRMANALRMLMRACLGVPADQLEHGLPDLAAELELRRRG